ncbi:hypothetical protein [Georgenia faecalis]|nr:hypothetical protein [Georgenia faecalis]
MEMEKNAPVVELAMQELEAMDAPFWGTAVSVVSGMTAVTAAGASVYKTLVVATIIAT